MDSKFNLYDFIVYVVPGLVIAAVAWCFMYFAAWSTEMRIRADVTIASGLFLLVGCYILGHLVQASRFRVFRKRRRWREAAGFIWRVIELSRWAFVSVVALEGARGFGEQLSTPNVDDELRHRDTEPSDRFEFPLDLRQHIRERLTRRFGLTFEKDSHYAAAWNLARVILVTHGLAGLSEVYNSIGMMCANLAIAFRVAASAWLIAGVSRLALGHADLRVVCALASALLAYFVSLAMLKQFRSLQKTYGRSVLLAFYAHEVGDARWPAASAE